MPIMGVTHTWDGNWKEITVKFGILRVSKKNINIVFQQFWFYLCYTVMIFLFQFISVPSGEGRRTGSRATDSVWLNDNF